MRRSDAGCVSGSFFRRERKESAAPGAASAARAGVRTSFAGRSGSARRQSGPRNELRLGPSTRIPLPSHAAAAACLSTPVPPAIRHAGLLRSPNRDTTSDHSTAARETSRHGLLPSARPTDSSGPRGLPRAAAQWPSRSRPRSRATATWRSVPLRRVDRTAAQIAARHMGHLPVPSHAGHFVRQRPPEAAARGLLSTRLMRD